MSKDSKEQKNAEGEKINISFVDGKIIIFSEDKSIMEALKTTSIGSEKDGKYVIESSKIKITDDNIGIKFSTPTEKDKFKTALCINGEDMDRAPAKKQNVLLFSKSNSQKLKENPNVITIKSIDPQKQKEQKEKLLFELKVPSKKKISGGDWDTIVYFLATSTDSRKFIVHQKMQKYVIGCMEAEGTFSLSNKLKNVVGKFFHKEGKNNNPAYQGVPTAEQNSRRGL